MYSVSEPEALLLVASAAHDNHESTLVVPGLQTERLQYYRCLVDTGPRFEEHAVVVEGPQESSLQDRKVAAAALSAARPTVVTFVGPGSGEATAMTADGESPSPAGRAAAAVCFLLQAGDLEKSAAKAQAILGGQLSQVGRFYSWTASEEPFS